MQLRIDAARDPALIGDRSGRKLRVDISDTRATQQGIGVADVEAVGGVATARHRLAVGLGEAALQQRGGLTRAGEHVAEQHGVLLVATGAHGERALAERLRVGHSRHLGHGRRLVGQQDRPLEVLPGLRVVHQHVGRLVLEGADELLDQAAEQCLVDGFIGGRSIVDAPAHFLHRVEQLQRARAAVREKAPGGARGGAPDRDLRLLAAGPPCQVLGG